MVGQNRVLSYRAENRNDQIKAYIKYKIILVNT
jgi:hypothetical protein